MSLTKTIKEYAILYGADVVGITKSVFYKEYFEEIKIRLKETQATENDFMLSTDVSIFFKTLSDARNSFPDVKSIIIGVYSFDELSDYRSARRQKEGKTARTYSYYPVIRQIAKKLVIEIKKIGYKAIDDQHIPLKYVASKIGLGT